MSFSQKRQLIVFCISIPDVKPIFLRYSLSPTWFSSPLLSLSFAVHADVTISVCPKVFSTFYANSLSKQTFIFRCDWSERGYSLWEAYCFVVTYWCARCAAVYAFSRIGDHRFPILKCENAVRTVFNTAWLSRFGAAVALIRKNYRKPRTM